MSVPPLASLAAGLLLGLLASARADDELMQKQLTMLASEVQFFSLLARQQKDELDKMKAKPCDNESPK